MHCLWFVLCALLKATFLYPFTHIYDNKTLPGIFFPSFFIIIYLLQRGNYGTSSFGTLGTQGNWSQPRSWGLPSPRAVVHNHPTIHGPNEGPPPPATSVASPRPSPVQMMSASVWKCGAQQQTDQLGRRMRG